MYLKEISQIIYTPGMKDSDRPITVKTYTDHKLIWEGKAKDLQSADIIEASWHVVEIVVDHNDTSATNDYNKGKIIYVI